MIRIFAPAKVNLYLAVGQAASDGYHPVRTVLQALAFGDAVVMEDAEGFFFTCTPDIGLANEENLAVRAARAMSATFDRALDVAITLEKHVPSGAGLGGASADAAAVITGLAERWGIVDETALHSVARSLGADVPFFLVGGAALLTGRGDVLERPLRSLEADVVLVKPADAVPTGAAYAAFDQRAAGPGPSATPIIDALEASDVGAVASSLYNAMTPSSVSLVPPIADALALVSAGRGIMGATMAGSGSAVFGIAASEEDAAACASAAREAGYWALCTRTWPDGCIIEGT